MNEAKCGYDHSPRGADLLVEFGPSLKVDIGFDPHYAAGTAHRPTLSEKGLNALIDTGASDSFIDRSLAAKLKLNLVDKDVVTGAFGTQYVNMYLVQISVLALDVVLQDKFAVVDLETGGFDCHLLLGRTFLRHFELTYHGPSGLAVIRHTIL
jgi:predicted aspartyl protease